MDIYKRIEQIGSLLFGAPSPRPMKTSVSDTHYSGIDAPVEDIIINVKGIEGYRKMRRDAEVAADTDIRLTTMIPGLQILPADVDEDAIAAAQFIESVMKAMDGDLEYTFRDQMLDEAIVTGFMVAEPQQKIIELPDYGKVIGLKSILVRPSEGFIDNIKVDEDGNIEYLTQITTTGNKDVTLDDVLYYAFKGQAWNPYGRSVYHAAYDWFISKQELSRLFMDFTTVNASGIKIYDIPDAQWQRDKASALDRLKRLGGRASIVKKLSHKLDIKIPPGTAGYNFIRGIRELCNMEIRKAILYDETINAASQNAVLSEGKGDAQSLVDKALLAQGRTFCTTMAEQLFRRILDANGFTTWPSPRLVPEASTKRDADPAPILASYVSAVTAGVLPRPSPEEAKQITRQVLRPMGVDVIEDAPEEVSKDETNARNFFAGAPPGRTHADLTRMKHEAIAAEEQGQADLTEVWNDNLPALKKALNNSLFDSAGAWKSKDYAVVRKAVEDNITTGGTKIRTVLTDMSVDRYKDGIDSAEKMTPIKAGVTVTPVVINPAAARKMLNQRVYLTMGKSYQDMTNDIYFILENAINGGISEREAMSQINNYLTEKGISPGRATTIVNTSLGQAYNDGRMSIFSQLSDPDGTTPGGIIGYQFSAVMDSATTEICESYDGQFFKVDDPSLPEPGLHYGCRSVLLPVFTGEEPWGGGEWTPFSESKTMTSGIQEGFGGN